jgi:molecular chaperone DnaK
VVSADAYVLGIDVGTTFSAAAVNRGGRIEAVSLGSVAQAIPSVVAVRTSGEEVLVGEPAETRALSEPDRSAKQFKRRVGDDVPIVLGGVPYGAEALTAYVIRFIVDLVTEREGGPPTSVVLTYPANWSAFKREILAEAARLAGLRHADLLAEPQAAAIAYAARERVADGAVLAVYDFGGGTFDVALLRRTGDGFELLGQPGGMDRLGGIDFDQAVFAHADVSVDGAASRAADDPSAHRALARLRADCVTAKQQLSTDTDAIIPVMLPAVQTEVRITRDEFEAMIEPRVRETIEVLERTVADAGLQLDEVGSVLLVGGSSHIPLVADMVREKTGRPVAVDAHPKLTIATGAAIWGYDRPMGAAGAPSSVETAPPVPLPAPPPPPRSPTPGTGVAPPLPPPPAPWPPTPSAGVALPPPAEVVPAIASAAAAPVVPAPAPVPERELPTARTGLGCLTAFVAVAAGALGIASEALWWAWSELGFVNRGTMAGLVVEGVILLVAAVIIVSRRRTTVTGAVLVLGTAAALYGSLFLPFSETASNFHGDLLVKSAITAAGFGAALVAVLLALAMIGRERALRWRWSRLARPAGLGALVAAVVIAYVNTSWRTWGVLSLLRFADPLSGSGLVMASVVGGWLVVVSVVVGPRRIRHWCLVAAVIAQSVVVGQADLAWIGGFRSGWKIQALVAAWPVLVVEVVLVLRSWRRTNREAVPIGS